MSQAVPDLPLDADPDALPAGTRLGEFEIERVLGVGGFGIVYLAFDHALQRRVAVKEYMPASLAARRGGLDIAVRSPSHAKTFGIGLRSFVNEARLLARFDHPALVKVHRFWEDHGTAYMAMTYYPGRTLGAARAQMSAPPNEAWLLALAEALLGALEALHREKVYHRDVAPDNILLLPGGGAVLLDFGAARHVIADRSQSLTAILKPNFAPIEQYAESARLRQGPWSDVYGLGAVLYFCLIGRAPAPAALRVLDDELAPLASLRAELIAADGSRFSAQLLAGIDAALQVRPEARPQDAVALRAALHGLLPAPAPAQPAAPVGMADARKPERAAFATTMPRPRLVTTAWATLGPPIDPVTVAATHASAQAPRAGDVRRTVADVLSAHRIGPRRFMLAVALWLSVCVLGYSLWRTEASRPGGLSTDALAAAQSGQAAAPAPLLTQRAVAAGDAPAQSSVIETTFGQGTDAAGPAAARGHTTDEDDEARHVTAPRRAAAPRPARSEDDRGRKRAAAASTAAAATSGVAQTCAAEHGFFLTRLICEQRACNREKHASDPLCIEFKRRQASTVAGAPPYSR